MKRNNFEAFKAFQISKAQTSQIVGGHGCQWSDGGDVTPCGGGSTSCKVNIHSDGRRCLECGGNEGSCRTNMVAGPGYSGSVGAGQGLEP